MVFSFQARMKRQYNVSPSAEDLQEGDLWDDGYYRPQ